MLRVHSVEERNHLWFYNNKNNTASVTGQGEGTLKGKGALIRPSRREASTDHFSVKFVFLNVQIRKN